MGQGGEVGEREREAESCVADKVEMQLKSFAKSSGSIIYANMYMVGLPRFWSGLVCSGLALHAGGEERRVLGRQP